MHGPVKQKGWWVSRVSPMVLEPTFQTTEKRIMDALGPIVLRRRVQQDHVLSQLNSHHQAD